ncbi:hypothetical protein [Edaphobacter aggregans]|uniref:hypothetical protein n=1 Tax=Edaphobacter aggregans TaxID=570835 RepID=UPI001B80A3E1|nr:hypothetical protein [Edaphobacter aggregans]
MPDAQTIPLRSSAGFTAILKMHSEDDHSKESHLCAADYILEISRPDGSAIPPDNYFTSDDDWGRPIAFRIDGFSPDGHHVFVFILEGSHPGWIEAMEYDMTSGAISKDVSLDRHFTRRLSRACAATLHIAGTSPAGRMVLGTSAKDGCPRTDLYQLSPNRYKGSLTGGAVLPQSPEKLPAGTRLTTLDPGSPVQPIAKIQ